MQANEKFAWQCHIVSFTFWTVIFGQPQWSKHQLFSQIQVCHNYALCCPHFDLDLAQTYMTGLRHICLAGDDLNSAKQNSVLNPLVMAQVPSVKSPGNARVLGIRRSSSHRKEVAGSCNRGSGIGKSRGMFWLPEKIGKHSREGWREIKLCG